MRGNKVLRKTVISALLLLTTVLVIPPPQAFSASLSAAEQLTDSSNIVTSGDGLYVDTYETGRYVYRGADPNNFIRFNDELWRIIAVEADGTLKIIMSESFGPMAWDELDARTTANGSTYCRLAAYGCNSWGSHELLVNGTSTGTVLSDATLNTYLNTIYYDSLSDNAKLQIKDRAFNVGFVEPNNDNLSEQITSENSISWTGKIGLISVSDYFRSNTDAIDCGTLYTNNNNSDQCKDSTYLYYGRYYWTIGARTDHTAVVYYVVNNGRVNGPGAYPPTDNSHIHVRPVIYLTPSLRIESGTGTSPDPYVVRLMGESDVSVSINSALALSLDTNDLVLEPVPNGEVAKEDVLVSVSTNDVVGYKLVMSVAEDSGNTNLNYLNPIDVGGNGGNSFSIPSTASTGELVANAWGYGIGESSSVSSFKPVPAYSLPDTLKTKSGLSLNDLTTVTFGTKVNMDLLAGSYQNTVAFTVIANI